MAMPPWKKIECGIGELSYLRENQLTASRCGWKIPAGVGKAAPAGRDPPVVAREAIDDDFHRLRGAIDLHEDRGLGTVGSGR